MAIKKGQTLAARESKVNINQKKTTPLGFAVTSQFKGYRNKEDVTNLPPGYLVPPSQNVIVNTSGQIQTRKGYTLDGQAGTSGNPILGSFDWVRGSYGDQHLRSGNSLLQYRYVATGGDSWMGTSFTAGQVYWITLASSLTSNYVKFTTFFDFNSEKTNLLLYVQRDSTITEWSGGVAILKSSTSNTITLNGTKTWAQLGFYTAKSPRTIVINGNNYTYTGGETTTTLTGVGSDPTGEAIGSVIHQLPVASSNQPAAGFSNDIIGNLKQQIYVASLSSNLVYLSKIYNYKDYTQASPRQPGDGYTATMDGLVRTIIPQETTMNIGWGDSGWTTMTFTLSSDLTHEAVTITPQKVAPLQGALSDGLTTNIGNDIAFITSEPTFSTLGRVANNLATPQITNMSDSIKNDMDSYGTTGFTDGQAIYTKYFIYVSVPTLGIVRRYNIQQSWWEPPFILPVGRFSVISGNIYGHSYLTDETYQLENGTNDNSNPIHCIAAMSYDNFEDRVMKKVFNEFYVEGYIAVNTTLNALTKFDFGGFSGIQTYQAVGTNQNIIFQTTADGSLGKNPLGEQPIGSITDSLLQLPKFRVIFTGIPTGFYEYQPYFETNDVDFQWAILAYGARIQEGASPMEIRI